MFYCVRVELAALVYAPRRAKPLGQPADRLFYCCKPGTKPAKHIAFFDCKIVHIRIYPTIFHKFFGKAIMNREQNCSLHNTYKFQIRSCSLDGSKVRSRVFDSYRVTGLTGSTGHFFSYRPRIAILSHAYV